MKHAFLFFLIFSVSLPVNAQKKRDLTDDQICRAAIATIFNKKVSTVSIGRIQKNIIYVSFAGEEGDKTTRFKCYLDSKEIVWATETGSYRNTDIDSVIDYETKNNILTVRETHKNGSAYRQTFDIKKLIAKK